MADVVDDVPVEGAGPVELSEPEPEPGTEEHAADVSATDGLGEAPDGALNDAAKADLEAGPEDGAEPEAAEHPAAVVDATAADERSDLPETEALAPDEPVGDLSTAEAPAAEPDTEEEAPVRVADEQNAEADEQEAEAEEVIVRDDNEEGGVAPEAHDLEHPMTEQAEQGDTKAVSASAEEEYESENAGSAEAQTPSYEFLDEQEPPLLPSTASAEHVAPSRTPRPAAAVAPSPSNKKSGKATSMSDIVLKESIKVLAKNILKLQELFRQWDPTGEGLISRKDWRKACPLIGISAASDQLDALFDRFDEDGDGFVSLPELQRAIRTGGKGSTAPAGGLPATGYAAPRGKASPTKGGREVRAVGALSRGADDIEEESHPNPGSAEVPPNARNGRLSLGGGRAKSKNPFREQDAATLSELAPLGLRVLGMPPEEWAEVQPPAADQIGAELERKSTVFETILRAHLQDTPGTKGAAGRVWETGASAPPLNPDQLELQRQVELDRLAALDAARRAAHEEQLARERHAISIQATVRGRVDRRRVAEAKPERTWRFQKCMHRTFDAGGANVARFYIEANEIIEIVDVTGAGRLLLTAVDPQGKQVVSSAVVFDSSAHHFDPAPSAKPSKGPAPPLWTAPGEHEYSFAMMPLEAPPSATRAGAAGSMTVLFRRVMTFTAPDLVEEAAPKPPTVHLDPYRRNPRRHSHLDPIRQSTGAPPQREALAPIGSAGRGRGPPAVLLDSPPSSRSSRGLPIYRTDDGGHAHGSDLSGHQAELGDRTRDRAAEVEAMQVEEERRYAAAHGLRHGVHSASQRASNHGFIPVHADGGAAASVFEQQREIQWQAQAQQAQYLAYLAATQQQQLQAAGWPDAATVYAQYVAQSYPRYGNYGAESATGPTEPKALMGPKVTNSPMKPRKGPRTGGFGR